MAAVDYEAEYNNRARVPEHPEIFARWAREAENYRADTLKAGRAQLELPMATRRGKSSICFFRRRVKARRSRFSFMAAGGARSIRRCSARWRAA